jgi:hypothetical protein
MSTAAATVRLSGLFATVIPPLPPPPFPPRRPRGSSRARAVLSLHEASLIKCTGRRKNASTSPGGQVFLSGEVALKLVASLLSERCERAADCDAPEKTRAHWLGLFLAYTAVSSAATLAIARLDMAPRQVRGTACVSLCLQDRPVGHRYQRCASNGPNPPGPVSRRRAHGRRPSAAGRAAAAAPSAARRRRRARCCSATAGCATLRLAALPPPLPPPLPPLWPCLQPRSHSGAPLPQSEKDAKLAQKLGQV